MKQKWAERWSNGQIQSLMDSDDKIWDKAVEACISIMKTRGDDHNLIAEMNKLKRGQGINK